MNLQPDQHCLNKIEKLRTENKSPKPEAALNGQWSENNGKRRYESFYVVWYQRKNHL